MCISKKNKKCGKNVENVRKQRRCERVAATSQLALWKLFGHLLLSHSQTRRIDRPRALSLYSYCKTKSDELFPFWST